MTFRLIHLAAPAASFAVLAVAMPAAAQDQATLWSGWYVGANLGATRGDNSTRAAVAPGNGVFVIAPGDVALINATGSGNSNKTGFTGGIEGGYNYRMGDWLLGLETEFVALDLNQSKSRIFQSTLLTPILPTSTPTTFALSQRTTTNWMWSLRPRVGYVVGPWLFYGTAGVASSNIKVSLNFADNRVPPDVAFRSGSQTKTGWIAGLGAGYAFTPQWSAKGEWLYADFGSISATALSPTGFVTLSSEAKVRTNILRVGVDYRF